AHWPGVTATRIAILGFSAGDALAVRAAADPRIRDSVAAVVSFGGYFDAQTLLTDVGQRGQLVDGHFQPWTPNPLPPQGLANTLAPTLPPNEGQQLANAFALNGTPLTPVQVANLSPPGAAAYHLLSGDQPERAQANVAALSPEMHDLLAALSPSTMLGSV